MASFEERCTTLSAMIALSILLTSIAAVIHAGSLSRLLDALKEISAASSKAMTARILRYDIMNMETRPRRPPITSSAMAMPSR